LPAAGRLPLQSGGRIALAFFLAILISCASPDPPLVVILTDMGDITAEIYTRKAPVTGSNFLSLVEKEVYSGALFYRVVRPDNQPDDRVRIQVIQGGLYDDSLSGSFSSIAHETTEMTGIRHTEGVISMARNEPGTASTEFFICIGNQPELDFGGARNPDGQGFAAFGKVVGGMDVVRAIQALPDSGQMLVRPVSIHEIRRLR
jgi:peptidyl-prolyl cis-trans isomerase A (cyclophilin A)